MFKVLDQSLNIIYKQEVPGGTCDGYFSLNVSIYIIGRMEL
jgi:hypothetical protein